MSIIVLGQHVSILIESSSGPSKKTDPYLEMFKMRCVISNNIYYNIQHSKTTHLKGIRVTSFICTG